MEACPVCKSHFKFLDLVVNSTMRKIVDTKCQHVVDTCRDIFNCLPAESVILGKISVSENKLCSIFVANAVKELFEVRQG